MKNLTSLINKTVAPIGAAFCFYKTPSRRHFSCGRRPCCHKYDKKEFICGITFFAFSAFAQKSIFFETDGISEKRPGSKCFHT